MLTRTFSPNEGSSYESKYQLKCANNFSLEFVLAPDQFVVSSEIIFMASILNEVPAETLDKYYVHIEIDEMNPDGSKIAGTYYYNKIPFRYFSKNNPLTALSDSRNPNYHWLRFRISIKVTGTGKPADIQELEEVIGDYPPITIITKIV